MINDMLVKVFFFDIIVLFLGVFSVFLFLFIYFSLCTVPYAIFLIFNCLLICCIEKISHLIFHKILTFFRRIFKLCNTIIDKNKSCLFGTYHKISVFFIIFLANLEDGDT
jgi:hypothetical protein